MDATRSVFRFAPSPNGRLHLGHAYSALLNAWWAERAGGRFLLRIEDIDITRCSPERTQHCLEDLAWLGLRWEEPVRMQSAYFEDYRQATQSLQEQGLLYPCFCTRAQVEEVSVDRDPDGAPLYAGTCAPMTGREAQARISAGEAHAWRIHMERALNIVPFPAYWRATPEKEEERVDAFPARWGDAVIVRKEIPASYHLAVVVDDALQGITQVVRGKDLEAATDIHTLLQSLLRLPSPRYYHHALMTEEGQKLAKSKGSESLAALRAQGISAAELIEKCRNHAKKCDNFAFLQKNR